MTVTVTIDVVTYDPNHDEWALYFVEDGPWPSDDAGWKAAIKAIQDRVLDAADAAIDGGLAKKYPETIGKRVRIQIDSPHGTPEQLEILVSALKRYLVKDPTYSEAIRASKHISGLRVVTGKELGRFGGK